MFNLSSLPSPPYQSMDQHHHLFQVPVMARPLRLEFPGAMYHVMARGNARQPIFLLEEDYHRFLENIGHVARRYDWRLWAYCLMGNHYHLVVETRRATLSRGMRQINGVYAQAFNRRHQRAGHLFQGRFRAIPIHRDRYLLELSRYVVLNPVRAGLGERPDDWAWSSYGATVGDQPAPEWLATQATLALFGRVPDRARQAYRRFVAEGIGEGDPSHSAPKPHVALGGEYFLQGLLHQVKPKIPSIEVPRRERIVPGLGVIYRSSTSRDTAIRKAYATGGYTLREIGSFFRLHASQISRIARGLGSAPSRRWSHPKTGYDGVV